MRWRRDHDARRNAQQLLEANYSDAQASAWSANEIARKEAVDAEAAVTKALAALEVAKLVEAEASWQATKARRARVRSHARRGHVVFVVSSHLRTC